LSQIESKNKNRKALYKIIIITLLTTGVCLVTWYFQGTLRKGITFSHGFYLPVITAALWWRRRGLAVVIILIANLMISRIINSVSWPIGYDLFRASNLLLVGITAVWLSERIDKTEKKAGENEFRFSEMFNHMKNGLAIYEVEEDGEHFITRCLNPAGEQIVGIKKEDIVGKRFFELLPIYKDTKLFELCQRVALTGKAEAFPVSIYKDQELIAWREYYIFRLQSGEIVTIFDDLTAQKKTDLALMESEKKYRLLFEESHDVIFISTFDGKFIDVNPAGIKLFGYHTRHEILNIDIKNELCSDPSDFDRIIDEIQDKGHIENIEILLNKNNGENISMLICANALENQGDKPKYFRGTFQDITEQRKLEQQFFQSQKMESLGFLAGGIAHDFNNLLGGILGYASFMKLDIQEDNPLFEYLGIIEKSARRASALTAQLLTFARGGTYNIRPIKLNDIVIETCKIIRRTFDRSIEIVTKLCEKNKTVKGDTGQLLQVIMNLCLNARDSMQQGGKLIIETAVETLTEEYIENHPEAKKGLYVSLSITDTGTGMNEKIKQRIFEPFFTTKETGKGTGLGLAMVYGVVKNHKGYIDVHSEPGKGSIFKIYLPISNDGIAKEMLINKNLQRGNNELILLVDDEKDVLSIGKTILERYDYRILTAGNGKEAIEVYKKHKDNIHLVIFDMIMPKMGGDELFLQLKEINPEVRTILASGYSKNGRAQSILDNGVMEFIQKPYQMQELLSTVRNVLKVTV
jgi:PAS domain S-box-containing protein